MKEKIDFADYLDINSRLEIKIGKIVECERVPKSKKMLKLLVDFDSEKRVVLTNIGAVYEPESLIGIMMPFITNLHPVEMMGIVSEAMIVIGKHNETEILNVLDYKPGTII
jgi:methionyl-tRNA synthetase